MKTSLTSLTNPPAHMITRPASSKALATRILAASVVIGGFAIQNASAAFIWDLRATHKNGVPLDPTQAKAIPTVLAGDTLEIGLWAVISGLTAAPEGFQSGIGKTISTHFGGAGGNQGSPVYEPLFVPPSNTLPTRQDLNGDGFFDLGITNTTVNNISGSWFPRTPTSPLFETAGTPVPNGTEFKLFHFTYTVINPGVDGGVTLEFRQQLTTIINSAAFSVDGSGLIASKNIGQPATANATTYGLPITVGVPEPTAFGMVVVGAMSLLGFRRLGVRRSNVSV